MIAKSVCVPWGHLDCPTNLLLLHQFRVWAVVDYILSKDWCGKNSINLIRVDILQLAIENEIIALSPQVYRGFLTE